MELHKLASSSTMLQCERRTQTSRVTSKQQKGQDAVTSWRTSWRMELSGQKSECSFLTTNTHEARWRPTLYLSRQQIKHSLNPKFLGITYDRQHSFGLHVSIVGSKMKQQAGAQRCLTSTDWSYEKSILHSV